MLKWIHKRLIERKYKLEEYPLVNKIGAIFSKYYPPKEKREFINFRLLVYYKYFTLFDLDTNKIYSYKMKTSLVFDRKYILNGVKVHGFYLVDGSDKQNKSWNNTLMVKPINSLELPEIMQEKLFMEIL